MGNPIHLLSIELELNLTCVKATTMMTMTSAAMTAATRRRLFTDSRGCTAPYEKIDYASDQQYKEGVEDEEEREHRCIWLVQEIGDAEPAAFARPSVNDLADHSGADETRQPVGEQDSEPIGRRYVDFSALSE